MDDGDRKLFEDSVRKATETLSGPPLDAALDELGWRDALADDPQVATTTLFRLQGAANATSTSLDDVVVHALGLTLDLSTAVVLPRAGRWDAPGTPATEGVVVHGLATNRIEAAETAVVVAANDDGTNVAVTVPRSELTLHSIHGIDDGAGLVEVRASISGTTATARQVSWPTAVAVGQVALGHELVGAATGMLQLARDHAVQRIQFGRPIASFQAVRHRLAESLVAIEAADAAVAAAAVDSSRMAAMLAKAMAGRSARTVAGHAQQVLGGIGFTAEHRLHRYLRRILLLDELFGDSRRLTREIGREVVQARSLPAMLPL
jgi:Acyl-CoA dehydrogenase, C-terminal domain